MTKSMIIKIILTVLAAAISAALGFFGGTTLSGCSSTGQAQWDVSTSVWKPFTSIGASDEDIQIDNDIDIEWSEDLL